MPLRLDAAVPRRPRVLAGWDVDPVRLRLAVCLVAGYVEAVTPVKRAKILGLIRGAAGNFLNLPAVLRMAVSILVATYPRPARVLPPATDIVNE